MASNIPTDDSPSGLSHNFPVEFQHGGTSLLRIVQQHSNHSTDGMMEIVLDDFQSAEQGTTPHHISRPEIASRQEPDLESQTVNIQQDSLAGQEPPGPLGPPLNDNHPSLELASPITLRHITQDGEHDPHGIVLPLPSKLTSAWMGVLAFGVLSLIILPGVILGVLMKQVLMGIALSGAIATVVGIFAGFYFYYS